MVRTGCLFHFFILFRQGELFFLDSRGTASVELNALFSLSWPSSYNTKSIDACAIMHTDIKDLGPSEIELALKFLETILNKVYVTRLEKGACKPRGILLLLCGKTSTTHNDLIILKRHCLTFHFQ